jgi:hypothetical protein
MLDEQNADGTVTAPDAAGQNAVPAWIAQCSDDLKGNEALTSYKTISDLAKDTLSLKEKATALEGKIATDYIPKLAENATDEQKQAYRAAMGVPEKPEEYEVELPEGSSPDLANWFKGVAHAIGMPKEQAKAISKEWNGFVAKAGEVQKQAEQKALSDGLAEIKTEWGMGYNVNAEKVKAAFTHFKDVPGLMDLMTVKVGGTDEAPVLFGNHPAAMRVFLEIGKKIVPDSSVPGAGSGDNRTIDEKAKDFYKNPGG